MPRPSAARKLVDRFKPGIFDRLKQSRVDRERNLKRVEPTVPVNTPTPAKMIISGSRGTTTMTFGNSVHDTWREWIVPTTITSNGVWTTWNSPFTNTGTTTAIWRTWTNHDTCADTGEWILEPQALLPRHRRDAVRAPGFNVVVEESEADKQRRIEQEALYAAQRERGIQEQKAREVAYKRAMDLLLSCLNPEQQNDLKTKKYFFVKAPSGRLYRIDEGMHGNVKVIHPTTRDWIENLCIQPNGVPAGDAMLMQKLMIETAEDAFRQYANITLKDGKLLRGKEGLLTGERLADIIPLRRVA